MSAHAKKFLVVIDGAGEIGSDFNVVAVEAATPLKAAERVAEMGYGRDEDGVVFVFPLSKAAVFTINEARRKHVAPASFDEIVEATAYVLRQYLDPDGGHAPDA